MVMGVTAVSCVILKWRTVKRMIVLRTWGRKWQLMEDVKGM